MFRFKQYGVFSVVYECIDQLVAMNSTQDFVLVIDAKVQAKDSSGRVVARFDRSLGFSVAQVKSYLQTADSATPAANDLISFQLQLRGLTIGDDSVSTVYLSGYRSDICPWIAKYFGSLALK